MNLSSLVSEMKSDLKKKPKKRKFMTRREREEAASASNEQQKESSSSKRVRPKKEKKQKPKPSHNLSSIKKPDDSNRLPKLDLKSPKSPGSSDGNLSDVKSPSSDVGTPINMIPPTEVTQKLRALHEPIRYFAESEENRCKRLRMLEILSHERETSSKGSQNEHRQIQKQIEKELRKVQKKRVSDEDMDIWRVRDDFQTEEAYLLYFLKKLLYIWESDLTESKLDAGKKRREQITYKQTRMHLKPFFKLLKNQSVPEDILECVGRMVRFTVNDEHLKCAQVYLKLAIGTAPWPMGLTRSSIHERSGDDKRAEESVAHIMNDENTRKYFHAVKRLLSRCEERTVHFKSKKTKQ